MRRMMRITSALVFVCASFLVGCAWGEGSPDDDTGGGVDAAVASGATCGDSICAASEVGSCSSDCGTGGGGGSGVNPICGNSTCETGETSASCPNDCGGGGGSGSGSGSGTACPTAIEECLTCVIDGTGCPAGHDMSSCTACVFGGGGLPI
jgi:hypothetical protein